VAGCRERLRNGKSPPYITWPAQFALCFLPFCFGTIVKPVLFWMSMLKMVHFWTALTHDRACLVFLACFFNLELPPPVSDDGHHLHLKPAPPPSASTSPPALLPPVRPPPPHTTPSSATGLLHHRRLHSSSLAIESNSLSASNLFPTACRFRLGPIACSSYRATIAG
jgi:hypothetical protein